MALEDVMARLSRAEDEVARLRDAMVSKELHDARMETLRTEISLVANMAETLSEQVRVEREEHHRSRLVVYGAALAAVSSIGLQVVGL